MKEDTSDLTGEELKYILTERLPEFLEACSKAEFRKEVFRDFSMYTPAGLPVVIPYREDTKSPVRFVPFGALRNRPDRVCHAAEYLRDIGMTAMGHRGFKLGIRTTSEYGSYGKPLREPAAG